MPVMLAERKPGVSIEVLELLVLQVEQLGEKCAKGIGCVAPVIVEDTRSNDLADVLLHVRHTRRRNIGKRGQQSHGP